MADIASPTDMIPVSPSTERTGAALSKDNKRAADLRESDVVAQLLRYREEAWHRDYVLRDKWLQTYQLYRNHSDFSDKAPWQSRLVLAKAHAAIKQFVANVIKLLQSHEQWVTVEAGEANPTLKHFAPLVEKVVLSLAGTPQFRNELRDSLEFGGIIGVMALRVDWAYADRNEMVQEKGRDGSSTPITGTQFSLAQKKHKEGYVKFTSVDPFHLWWGPRTRGMREFDWVMEESYADIAALKDAGGFDNLDKIWGDTPDQSAITRSYEQQRKDKRIAPETTRKQIHLLEYWGDLVDTRTNEIVSRNRHIIIANRTTVIKNEPNPYWDEKPPYILSSPLLVAGRWPGQGILESSLSALNEDNRIAQKMADHMSFSVVPMLEVEWGALENPEGDVQTGIMPGKVWSRKAGMSSAAVQGIQMPQLSNAAFNFQLSLGKEIQRSTFISEQVQGLTDAKGETTATEVTQIAQYSSTLIGDIARHIEDGFLTPLAETLWSRAFQFLDVTSRPSWSDLLGPTAQFLDHLPRAQRVPLIQSEWIFKAQGLSRALQRQENLARYIQFVQTVVAGAPQFIPLINMPAFFQRIFEGYHFPDPAELVPENVQAVYARMQENLANQGNPAVEQAAIAQGKSQVAGAQGDQQSIQQLLQAAFQHMQPPAPGGATQ